MIHRLPESAARFSTTVDNVHGSSATSRVQHQAERHVAAATVRDAVRREAQLIRAGNTRPEELARVRARIAAYCADYEGLDALARTLRERFRLPSPSPAPCPAPSPAH